MPLIMIIVVAVFVIIMVAVFMIIPFVSVMPPAAAGANDKDDRSQDKSDNSFHTAFCLLFLFHVCSCASARAMSDMQIKFKYIQNPIVVKVSSSSREKYVSFPDMA
jgi:hypothetical protein